MVPTILAPEQKERRKELCADMLEQNDPDLLKHSALKGTYMRLISEKKT